MGNGRDRIAELRARIAEQRRQEDDGINAILDCVRRSDFENFVKGLWRLDSVFDGWRRGMRAIARLNTNPSEDFRCRALQLWAKDGDELRGYVADDLLLLGALRAILPVYRGPGLRLWRGDCALNRQRRTYGLAWSRQRDVADGFARGHWRLFEGGSVLLETDALPDAVICVVEENNPYGEEEVLVDRRRLTEVRVIARYTQVSHEEHCKQMLREQLTQES